MRKEFRVLVTLGMPPSVPNEICLLSWWEPLDCWEMGSGYPKVVLHQRNALISKRFHLVHGHPSHGAAPQHSQSMERTRPCLRSRVDLVVQGNNTKVQYPFYWCLYPSMQRVFGHQDLQMIPFSYYKRSYTTHFIHIKHVFLLWLWVQCLYQRTAYEQCWVCCETLLKEKSVACLYSVWLQYWMSW
jgi:hypothetical protein